MKSKFEIKRLKTEDLVKFNSLFELFNPVFEEEAKIVIEKNLLRLLGYDHFIANVALAENEIVGCLTVYELPMYYSDSSGIFLYDLAVKPEYQSMGIGKGLLQSLKEYCIENEIQDFFVMVHEEDEHAIEVYRATGGKAEKAVNFVYELEA